MKTKIIVEIETPDTYNVYPEDLEDFESLPDEEKKKYREEFAKGYHELVVKTAKSYFEEEDNVSTILEDDVMDDLEEYAIDGWENFDDYKTEVSVEVSKED